MTLSRLFARCVNRSYLRTPESADYAYDLAEARLTIYFQDSDGAVDWLRNLDFPAAAYRREGKTAWYAHRGFLQVWNTLIPRMEPLILDPNVRQITVVGYSHGAALAVFCHEYVRYHRPELGQTLTGYGFGCPRVVWGTVPADVADRWKGFTVIRNRDDVVTHLPPSVLGYRHVGALLEIGEKGKYAPLDAHRPESIRRELLAYESRPQGGAVGQIREK